MPTGFRRVSPQQRLTDRSLQGYLRGLGLLGPTQTIRVEPAGAGNINWVRRAIAESGSWVVKQARPELEAFPEYSAPTTRLAIERLYYETVRPHDREGVAPRLIHFDPLQCVLVMEDLVGCERLDAALARGADVTEPARAVGSFLGAVHAATRDPDLAERFANEGMQRLHGDHIFHLPYRENDFPLSPALRDRARAIWRDGPLVARIDAAYRRYLEPVGALVHADVQPTNVLLPPGRSVLLDAEIAHVGDPAFDIGTWMAHLQLPAIARGRPETGAPAMRTAWRAYCEAHGAAELPAFRDASIYAGIELLRRTLGAARPEAVERDEAALAVIDAGLRWVLEPPEGP